MAADRAAVIERAKAAERDYESALSAGRRSGFNGMIRTPPRLVKTPERVGLGYVSAGGGDYDWFYGLSKAEQTRVRDNWFTGSSSAASPDEVEDMGLSMREWLALTRGIDAARALQTRSQLSRARYGGRDPMHFLDVGEPEDHGERHEPDYHDAYGSKRVQFFTDKNGEVHPIRASYERPKTAADKQRAANYEEEEPF